MTNYFFLNLSLPLLNRGITYRNLPKKFFSFIDETVYLSHEIRSFFTSRKIAIIAQSFYKTPIARSIIHVDYREVGDYAKINWVFGGGNSQMCWFDINENYDPNNPSNTPCLEFRAEEVNEIERATLKNPTVVQSGIPHCIVDVTEERWCVSIELLDIKTKARLTMEQAKSIFSDLVV